jgi:hypothetical protein
MVDKTLCFFNKFGLQRDTAESLNLTINIVVAINQTDIFDFSAGFDGLRGKLHFSGVYYI